MLVYLCGPITGLTYQEARFGWRAEVATALSLHGIDTLSPMRWKDQLKDINVISAAGYTGHVLSSSRGIITRDRFDTTRSDLIFCNFLGAPDKSLGSAIEFGWADLGRVPVVMAIEEEGNPNDHCMLREIAGFTVASVEEGVQVIKDILIPVV